MTIRGKWILLGLAGAALACACRPPAAENGTVELANAWARATAPGQEVSAVYLTVRNNGSSDDRLVGGSTLLAKAVEIHTMRLEGAIMRMRRQDGLDIPAGGSAELGPGGTHLMLIGLEAPLVAGATVSLSLDFARAGRKVVSATVEPIGATGPAQESR